ncbi:MAG: hypothetical protein ACYDBB_25995 [Armatimonadota bacterium]
MSWQHLKHGSLFERMIGFSLPIDGIVAVISYEGIHLIPLAQPDAVIHHPELAEGGDAYDWKHQRFDFAGLSFSMLGLYGGTPRLLSSHGEQLAFATGDELILHNTSGEIVFSYTYNDLSGDWWVVTFSPDDEYIIFGLPYELDIFRRDG